MRPLLALFLLLSSSLPALAHQPRILFDEGHGQAFVIEQQGGLHLSQLATIFTDQNYEVSSTFHPLNAKLLGESDALIISGAFKPYNPAEIDAIRAFVARGGRVAVMVHIGKPVLPLLMRLGIDVANGVIREKAQVIGDDPLNFRTSHLTKHPLTHGLNSFSLYGSWPLRALTTDGRSLARTSAQSWVDLSGDRQLSPGDAVQSFDLVVETRIGAGRLVVFGDDALFQNRFLNGDNRKLAENLGHWLTAGKTPRDTEI